VAQLQAAQLAMPAAQTAAAGATHLTMSGQVAPRHRQLLRRPRPRLRLQLLLSQMPLHSSQQQHSDSSRRSLASLAALLRWRCSSLQHRQHRSNSQPASRRRLSWQVCWSSSQRWPLQQACHHHRQLLQ
jgi:hypothetical protein